MARLVLVNDGNRSYTKVRLDHASLTTVTEHLTDIEDPLSRAVIWATLWDMTRDGEIAAQRYAGIATRHLGLETNVTLIEENLALVRSAIDHFADPAARDRLREDLATMALAKMRAPDTDPDARLAWFTCFVAAGSVRDRAANRNQTHVAVLRGVLDGAEHLQDVVLSRQMRWQVIVALAGAAVLGEAEIAAEEQRDHTNDGHRRALQARAAQPTGRAKAEAWRLLTAPTAEESASLAVDDLPHVAAGFMRPGQDRLLRRFGPLYLPAMRRIADERGFTVARVLAVALYPRGSEVRRVNLGPDAVTHPVLPPAIARLVNESADDATRARRARAVDIAATRTASAQRGPDPTNRSG